MDTSLVRRNVVVERLEAERLDALVAVAPAQHSFLNPNPVFVLSGVKPIGDSAVIVRRDGSAALVVTPRWDEARVAAGSTTTTTHGADDLASGVAMVLAKDRIALAAVATDGIGVLGLGVAEKLEGLFGGRARVMDGLVNTLSRRRSAQELERAERASWIAERGYERLIEIARPGLREYEMVADIYCRMKELGGDDNFLLVSASQHNLAVRAAGGRVLEEGDIILAEITPSFEGQFAQICRTVAIGKPPAGYVEKYAILQEAMRRGQRAAVPGAKMSDVAEVINGPLREAGYGDYCRPPYMRVRGHGLGVTSNLPGDVVSTNHTVLEEGMVFVMHPNQYLPETGYLMCGEPVVITPRGARALCTNLSAPDVVPT